MILELTIMAILACTARMAQESLSRITRVVMNLEREWM